MLKNRNRDLNKTPNHFHWHRLPRMFCRICHLNPTASGGGTVVGCMAMSFTFSIGELSPNTSCDQCPHRSWGHVLQHISHLKKHMESTAFLLKSWERGSALLGSEPVSPRRSAGLRLLPRLPMWPMVKAFHPKNGSNWFCFFASISLAAMWKGSHRVLWGLGGLIIRCWNTDSTCYSFLFRMSLARLHTHHQTNIEIYYCSPHALHFLPIWEPFVCIIEN